jgi:hypothetical protein
LPGETDLAETAEHLIKPGQTAGGFRDVSQKLIYFLIYNSLRSQTAATWPNLLVAQTRPAVRFAVAFSPPAAGGFFVLTKSNNRENF